MITAVSKGQTFQGNACWNLDILWETTQGKEDLGNCKLEVGMNEDPNKYPYIYVALGPVAGTSGEPVALIAKRVTNDVTVSERQALGLRMTGKQFQQHMNKETGRKIQYESDSDDDYTEEEDEDGTFEDEDELEESDEWQMDETDMGRG